MRIKLSTIARLPPRVSAYLEHTKLQKSRAYHWKSENIIGKEVFVASLIMGVSAAKVFNDSQILPISDGKAYVTTLPASERTRTQKAA